MKNIFKLIGLLLAMALGNGIVNAAATAATNATKVGNAQQLFNAVTANNLNIVEALLNKGVPVDTIITFKSTPDEIPGMTALMLAARFGHTAIVEFLLSRGALIEAVCKRHRTPLIYAATYGHPETVRLLLHKGAAIDARCDFKRTPLMFAAEMPEDHKCTEVIRLLLDKGASVNATDCNGMTALMLVAMADAEISITKEIVALLFKYGVDHTMRDNGRRSALDYARDENNHDMGALLEAHAEQAVRWSPLRATFLEGVLSHNGNDAPVSASKKFRRA